MLADTIGNISAWEKPLDGVEPDNRPSGLRCAAVVKM